MSVRVLLGAIALMVLASVGTAQDHAVLDAIARARAAAREGPHADRVTIMVRTNDVIRFDRFEVYTMGAGARRGARIDLPALEVWLSSTSEHASVTARRAEGAGRVFHAALDAPLHIASLRGVMPPIPAPQLDLLLDDAQILGVPDAQWHAEDHDGEEIVLRASTSAGQTTLVLDASSSRPLRAEVREPTGLLMRLRFDPIEAGDPSAWAIGIDGKRVVSSIVDLHPSEALVAPGDDFPIRTLQDAAMRPWSIAAALAPSTPARGPEERYLILILHRVPTPGPKRTRVLDLADDAISASSGVRQDLTRRSRGGLGPRGSGVRVLVRPVACLKIPGARRERIARLARRWSLDTGGSALLWIVSPEETIDRLVPGGEVVVAIIDDQERLVEAIDADRPEAELRQRIEHAIMREVNLVPDDIPAGDPSAPPG